MNRPSIVGTAVAAAAMTATASVCAAVIDAPGAFAASTALAAPAASTATAAPAAPAAPHATEAAVVRGQFVDALVDLQLRAVAMHVVQQEGDAIEAAETDLALRRAALASGDVAPGDRGAAIDTLLDRSLELIRSVPDHPRQPRWRLDLAEDAWRWGWTHEACGLQALVGVPDRAARRRAERVARIMDEVTADTAAAIDRAIATIEAQPGFPGDALLQQEWDRLTGTEQAVRLPQLRAIADLFAARLLESNDAWAARRCERAVAPLQEAADRMLAAASRADGADAAGAARAGDGMPESSPDGTPSGATTAAPSNGIDARLATTATLRRLQAEALVGAGRPGEARAVFDAAIVRAEAAGDALGVTAARLGRARALAFEAGPDRVPSTVREALGAIAPSCRVDDAGSAAEAPPPLAAADAAGRDRFTDLLASDLWYRLHRRVAEHQAAEGGGSSDRGADSWRRAGLAWRRHAAMHGLAGRAAVLARWDTALDGSEALDALTPFASVAAAYGSIDPLRADGILARVADRPGLWPGEIAEIAVRRSTIARDAGRLVDAGRFLATAAANEPDAARARTTMDAALRTIAAAARSGWTADVDAAFAAACDVLEARHATLPGADAWRLIRVQRLAAGGALDAAEQTLDAIRARRAGTDANDGAARDADANAPSDADAPSDAELDVAAVRIAVSRLRHAVNESGAPEARRTAAVDLHRRLDVVTADAAADPARRLTDEGWIAAWRAEALLAQDEYARAWTVAEGLLARTTDADPAPASDPGAPSTPAAGPLDIAAAVAARVLAETDDDGLAARVAAGLLGDVDGPGFGRVAARLDAVVLDLAGDARPVDDPARTTDAQRRALPLARALAARLAQPLPPDVAPATVPRARVAIADARRLAGDAAGARADYDALGGAASTDPRILLGHAESGVAIGTEAALADAMRTYRRLAADRGAIGDDAWWRCQLRMLQILERVDRQTGSILPRVVRLERDDPSLGGPRYRPAFEALRERLGGAGTP